MIARQKQFDFQLRVLDKSIYENRKQIDIFSIQSNRNLELRFILRKFYSNFEKIEFLFGLKKNVYFIYFTLFEYSISKQYSMRLTIA